MQTQKRGRWMKCQLVCGTVTSERELQRSEPCLLGKTYQQDFSMAKKRAELRKLYCLRVKNCWRHNGSHQLLSCPDSFRYLFTNCSLNLYENLKARLSMTFKLNLRRLCSPSVSFLLCHFSSIL